jgi:hypothetical protein
MRASRPDERLDRRALLPARAVRPDGVGPDGRRHDEGLGVVHDVRREGPSGDSTTASSPSTRLSTLTLPPVSCGTVPGEPVPVRLDRLGRVQARCARCASPSPLSSGVTTLTSSRSAYDASPVPADRPAAALDVDRPRPAVRGRAGPSPRA